MSRSNIVIQFAAVVAEIINGGTASRQAEVFSWKFYEIYIAINALLSGREYCHQPATLRYAKELTGAHLHPERANEEMARELAAEDYFQCVFERPVKNPKKIANPPTTRLQETLRSHCQDSNKQKEENLSEPSLWQILQRAGTLDGNVTGEISYNFWTEKEAFQRLHYDLVAVLNSANRLYGEIYRLGLYPPMLIKDGAINTSQVRKLNALLKKAKAQAQDGAATWQACLKRLWNQGEEVPNKFGEDDVSDFAAFRAHFIGQHVLGLHRVRIESYDEMPALLNKGENAGELSELPEREHVEQMREQLAAAIDATETQALTEAFQAHIQAQPDRKSRAVLQKIGRKYDLKTLFLNIICAKGGDWLLPGDDPEILEYLRPFLLETGQKIRQDALEREKTAARANDRRAGNTP